MSEKAQGPRPRECLRQQRVIKAALSIREQQYIKKEVSLYGCLLIGYCHNWIRITVSMKMKISYCSQRQHSTRAKKIPFLCWTKANRWLKKSLSFLGEWGFGPPCWAWLSSGLTHQWKVQVQIKIFLRCWSWLINMITLFRWLDSRDSVETSIESWVGSLAVVLPQVGLSLGNKGASDLSLKWSLEYSIDLTFFKAKAFKRKNWCSYAREKKEDIVM